MQGFKDDFYAWKDSLSKDEQALILKQAQNEFDKKFRKSDEFSKDLPEEKIQSFAKVLKKFFDNDSRLHFDCFCLLLQQRSTRRQAGLVDYCIASWCPVFACPDVAAFCRGWRI